MTPDSEESVMDHPTGYGAAAQASVGKLMRETNMETPDDVEENASHWLDGFSADELSTALAGMLKRDSTEKEQAMETPDRPFMPEADVTKEEIDAHLSASRRPNDEILWEIRRHQCAIINLVLELISEPAGLLGDSRRPTDDTNGTTD